MGRHLSSTWFCSADFWLMGKLETIWVFHPNGKDRLLMNFKDFDKSVHRRWEASEPVASAPSPPTRPDPTPPSAQPIVINLEELKKQRQAELETMDWREVKAIAEAMNPPIVKPEGGSWDDTIPLILKREFQ